MTSATLVIDVQQGLCEGDQFAHDAARVIERINSVTRASRAAGAPVVFVQHASRPGGLLERGTPPWQFADGLHVEPGDLRLDKSTPDCFERTGLDALLRSRGVGDLVICGMQTEFCVDTTTRRALALGYPVWLVADAHTTGDSDTLSAAQVIAHHNRTLALITSFGPRAKLVDAGALSFGTAVDAPSAQAAVPRAAR
jgi:nicotinamidase-related amidase